MDLLIELIKLAAALAQLAVSLRRIHPTNADDDRDNENEGR